jgi:hypothetical protein
MKTKLCNSCLTLILLTLVILNTELSTTSAQGTAFTYQGRLNDGGNPANGLYDFRFKLASDDLGNNYVGDAYLTNAIPVTNGQFITTVDFGAGIFTGSNYWLEVDVRTNNPANTLAYTTLAPLQGVTPTPYSVFANTASNVSGTVYAAQLSGPIPGGQLSGTYPGAVNFDNPANSFAGNGGGLTNVNAATVSGLNATNFWQTAGNSGTTAGVNYLGTMDNQPVELHAFSLRALRLEPGGVSSYGVSEGSPAPTGAPNVIGGAPANFVAPGTVGAVIEGGGATNWLGTGATNSIASQADFSTIGGGFNNTIQFEAVYSAIGGGHNNTIQSNSYDSTLGGGHYNTIQSNSYNSTVAGGYDNTIEANSPYCTISGGLENFIETNSVYSTVVGGYYNFIQNNSAFATVVGGYDNFIQNNSAYSTVVGGVSDFIETNSSEGFIGGGYYNYIENNSSQCFIGGGYYNYIENNSADSTIGGGYNNSVGTNSGYSIIAGGMENFIQNNAAVSAIGGGDGNGIYSVSSDIAYSFIGGGLQNDIQTNAPYSFIGGGLYNNIYGDVNDFGTSVIVGGDSDTIYPGSFNSTIGGGENNSIGTNSDHAALGGGYNNTIGNTDYEGTIPGGYYDTLLNGAAYATIGGGQYNTNSSNGGTIAGGQQNLATGQYQSSVGGGYGNIASGSYSTVPGGILNSASGLDSFAAGYHAQAMNSGAFVWSDSSGIITKSFANNQFLARASGGVILLTSTAASPTSYATGSAGVALLPNATSWTTVSDRNAKKNFKPVDTVALLDRLAAIPIQQWNYKWEKDTDVPNIGPMAQDFKQAFYPGRDDRGISTLEFDGVELAAIQGLNQKLNEKDARIQEQGAEIETLKQNLANLQRLVQTLAAQK